MTERVEEIRLSRCACNPLQDHYCALAQAERERDNEKIACDAFQRLASERVAEVERLLIENDAARKSIGEAWDTAVADGGKIRSLEAEVERLKADLKVADEYAHQMVSRWNKTEADLARTRAALKEIAEDADGVAAEVIVGVAERRTWRSIARKARAALEGR